ncbi:dTDP-4-dehydrorhamnose 3,5-epimerase [Reichenbachiella faecimaris]|uniref:dTDP-4-dehydrorhamnose 3,5-epimerase n=1 Tax=Reichenbachiella faecimaris TaxID=692418 RepID=A0A1W2GCZ5_REIFA|nr:dTDP-4-dehydrorhamnose 3,5-epimerase family protein [Reichenbachiella faecimaris]SMD34352.1 dTDP-4-dehydrorhamnose 3,5-epimerase [Reichenbachiella faecimaris]
MNLIEAKIPGLFLVENNLLRDNRGTFLKTFQKSVFEKAHSDLNFSESYYSVSQKDVIRGMHFQIPPEDHHKLIYVPKGKILDVVLDLRKQSDTFGQFESFELSSENAKAVLIPKGCAHGFRSLEDDTITIYAVTTEYNNVLDLGIKWESFGFNWGISKPIISARDLSFPSLEDFKNSNPF